MKFREFSEAVGIPQREIRYLMSLDIIPPALARGRYADGFGEAHLAAARRYVSFAATGLTAREIAALPATLRPPDVVLRMGGLEVRILPEATARDLEEDAVRAFLKHAEAALTERRSARPAGPHQTSAIEE